MGRTIYFVAGTPTDKGPETYPVVLYSADRTKRLSFVRTVVQDTDGLYWVLDDLSGTLAVAYPHVDPTAVSIIHEDDPSVSDVVVFNPKGLMTLDYGASAAIEDNNSFALFVALPNGPTGTPSLIKVRLNSSAGGARVTQGDVTAYAGIRTAGQPGGGEWTFVPSGKLIDHGMYAYLGDREYQLLRAPVPPPPTSQGYVDILAASSRFLAFYPSRNLNDIAKETSRTIWIFDRQKGGWDQMDQPGNLSRTRLCGPWLATIEQRERQLLPGAIPAQPLDPHDPHESGETPAVQRQYWSFQGAISEIPGILIMNNLEDLRKIVIDTGQEDSEVLWADDKTVLYRVNDTIYQAKITGDRVGSPDVVVKDRDVPEIHWAFWGPATRNGKTTVTNQRKPD